uniref:Uncharacterized protein n=1 Tax=viral metagenome TaxID=1070528 RepID=A0A6M3JZV2_9ZZZZ
MAKQRKVKSKQLEDCHENVIALWRKEKGIIETPNEVRKYTELETWLKDLYESQH